MRTIFEEDEELETERRPRNNRGLNRGLDREDDNGHDHEDDREVTLSSTTLLLIFFGLVLICALFFGLGYTLGRRSSPAATALQTSAAATPSSTLQPNGQSKPSAAAQPTVEQPSQSLPEAASDSTTPDASSDSTPPEPAVTATPKPAITPAPEAAAAPHQAKEVKAALPATSPSAAQPQTPATTATPAGTPAGTWVQIAAISNPADADVLVRALQKHGYSVTVRHAPTDTLLHVQIGPYPIRADAIAMRQRLLADGYNAILK